MDRTIASAVVVASTLLVSLPAIARAGSQRSQSSTALINKSGLEIGLGLDNQLDHGVIASGSIWTKGANKVIGGFSFDHRSDGTYLVVDKDFDTKKGPDLKFVLSPIAHDKVKGKTALNGSVIISLLKSNKGAQEFKLPEGVNVDDYKSLLVHCEQYTKLWAAAPIRDGEVLAHGSSWTKKSNKITGQWEIARTDAGLVIRFGDDFKTKKAPDLKVFLSTQSVKSANGNNATNGATMVAKLKSVKGGSKYLLKGVADLSSFDSLLIHCEQYSKLWGGVDL
jgi:Electron transfer DM13